MDDKDTPIFSLLRVTELLLTSSLLEQCTEHQTCDSTILNTSVLNVDQQIQRTKKGNNQDAIFSF
jgi:hypothetical protein